MASLPSLRVFDFPLGRDPEPVKTRRPSSTWRSHRLPSTLRANVTTRYSQSAAECPLRAILKDTDNDEAPDSDQPPKLLQYLFHCRVLATSQKHQRRPPSGWNWKAANTLTLLSRRTAHRAHRLHPDIVAGRPTAY